MSNKYRVWLSYTNATGTRQKLNGDIMAWSEIQSLIGEKLLEMADGKARQVDVNSYVFSGKYHSAGDQYLDHGYNLDFETVRE